MNIINQLEFELNFTTSEKEIAHYVLENGQEVLKMNVTELAKATYSSPATIVRLTKKLGLEGFNDFKIKFSAELQAKYSNYHTIDVNYPFTKDDSKIDIANKLATMEIETIQNTLHLFDYKSLEKIIPLLDQAESIDLYGSSNSLLAAMSFQHKMTRIFKNVNLRSVHGEQIFFAKNSNSKHVAIVLSYSGETEEVIRCVKVLKQVKTPILLITSVGENQLTNYTNYIIRLDSREKIFNKIAPYASFLSMNFCLDYLYSLIFQLNYDKLKKEKVNFDKNIDERHPYLSPINEIES